VGVDGEQRFVIAVSDTGIGIAEDDLPWALTPFGQLENSQIRKHDGTGLGLPLVQKLVELHGGAFELESEAGAGTTAIARFPSQRTVYR
jgi:two-component system cell cycle sensor histidine kinase PleC